MSDWEEDDDLSLDTNKNVTESNSGGFGSNRGGFGNKGGFKNDNESSSGGFGSSRGQRNGFGGGGGGFGRDSNNDDDGNRGGFGGGRGRRGGFGGGFGRDSNNDDDDRGGFGGGRGRRGGFGGGRGFNRDSSEQNGFDDSNDSGGGRGGFGGGRGRGGFGRGRGGFGGGRGQSHDGDGTENGFDNDNNRRSGGFGRGRGGGFSGGTDGDDGGGQGGGFRGRRNSNTADAEGGDAFQNAGEEKPERVTYIPPAPPEEEQEIFKTMQQGINFDNYDNIAVEMSGRDHEQVRPITSFEHCDLYETFKENVKKAHYTKPTPVQKYSIPAILAGRDLMACAQTGSGKTAAFVLPVMTGMINNGLTGGSLMTTQTPQALVVAPTRELANQIYLEARKFAYGTMLRACVCYGGVAVGHQLRQIENGCHLLVATPGRLLDFIERGKISLEAVKFLILDEADRMLDMGFEPTIRKLSDNPALPSKTERQTLMFSATFPEEIQRLAGEFLNDYLFLTVGRVGGTTSDIEQHIVQVSEFEKRDKLVEILNGAGTDRFLVFVETKRSADFLASYLSQTGFPTTSIHGDRQQREREEALEDFKRGRTPVMVATSVAARGLDIPDVKHVINYDLPKEIEEYVHRIGRTGRIGNKGKATSFFQSDRDSAVARGLVKVLGDAEQEVPDWLEENAENAVGTNYGPAGGRFGSRDTRKNNRDGGGDGGNDAGGWGPGDTNDGDDWTSNTAVVDDGGESWD